MSRTGRFDYALDAPGTPATAVALLADPRRHPELHPLIVAVEQTDPGTFLITDSLPLGPLRFRIRYVAEVVTANDSAVVIVARQAPATTVRNETSVTAVAGGIHVAVSITLTAPTLLFGYAFRTARRAHAELAERIRQRLAELAS